MNPFLTSFRFDSMNACVLFVKVVPERFSSIFASLRMTECSANSIKSLFSCERPLKDLLFAWVGFLCCTSFPFVLRCASSIKLSKSAGEKQVSKFNQFWHHFPYDQIQAGSNRSNEIQLFRRTPPIAFLLFLSSWKLPIDISFPYK